MNAKEISDYIRNSGIIKEINFGITSIDLINKIEIVKPAGLIVNTDVSQSVGKHWVCFYFPIEGPAEFFDSVGHSPQFYNKSFTSLLIVNGPKYIYNTKRIQNFDSNYCGQYCIYYLFQKCQNVTFEEFLTQFSSNFINNDEILLQKLTTVRK